jgi:hypothetical protein
MTRIAVIEGRVQIGIMLLMGGGAGAASFKHIHDLAVHYGQPSWIGWANASVVELMSIVSGLEIRRRKRAQPRQSTGFVYLVFFGAVLISLAANVAKAHPSPWGWIMAALPALGFLAVVKIVLTRQPVEAEPDRSGSGDAGPVQFSDRTADLDIQRLANPSALWSGPDRTIAPKETDPISAANWSDARGVPTQSATHSERSDTSSSELMEIGSVGEVDRELDRSIDESVVPVQRVNGRDTNALDGEPMEHERLRSQPERHKTPVGPVRDRTAGAVSGPARDRSAGDVYPPPRSQADYELLELGKTIAAKLAMRRKPLTRQTLINEIRGGNGTISTDRASALLQWLKADEALPVGSG